MRDSTHVLSFPGPIASTIGGIFTNLAEDTKLLAWKQIATLSGRDTDLRLIHRSRLSIAAE
ncbi:hypothetical protein WG66_009136 [Moniliophthora roreri]|nr:hypothetical protein WG66_009136 [Moniliophthora roreri]